jgi:hypothetical protein
LNLRPPACKADALPLSYPPVRPMIAASRTKVKMLRSLGLFLVDEDRLLVIDDNLLAHHALLDISD